MRDKAADSTHGSPHAIPPGKPQIRQLPTRPHRHQRQAHRPHPRWHMPTVRTKGAISQGAPPCPAVKQASPQPFVPAPDLLMLAPLIRASEPAIRHTHAASRPQQVARPHCATAPSLACHRTPAPGARRTRSSARHTCQANPELARRSADIAPAATASQRPRTERAASYSATVEVRRQVNTPRGAASAGWPRQTFGGKAKSSAPQPPRTPSPDSEAAVWRRAARFQRTQPHGQRDPPWSSQLCGYRFGLADLGLPSDSAVDWLRR